MVSRACAALLLAAVLLTALFGCGGDKHFNAVVISNSGGLLLIRADEASAERQAGESMVLSTDGVAVESEQGSAFTGSDIQEGARLRVYYSGAVSAGRPARLEGCTRIVLLNAA